MKSRIFILGLSIGASLCLALPPLVLAKPATKPEPPPGVSYKGGDGSDCQHAVIIKGASDEAQIVDAKKRWLEWRYPGHTKVKETTSGDCSGRFAFSTTAEGTKLGPIHEVMTVTTVDGHEKTVWFDFKPPMFMLKPAASSK